MICQSCCKNDVEFQQNDDNIGEKGIRGGKVGQDKKKKIYSMA